MELNLFKSKWIDWIPFITMLVLAPFFLFPSMKSLWIFASVPLVLIFKWLVTKQLFQRTALDLALALLFIQIIATCFIIPDIPFSLPKITGVLFGILFYYTIVTLLISERLIRWSVILFSGCLFFFFGICIVGMDWKSADDLMSITRAATKIIPKFNFNLPGAEKGFNPNAIAGTVILFIPLFLLLFLSQIKGKKPRLLEANHFFTWLFFLVILLVMSLVLFLTQSIASWVGLVFSIWIFLLSRKWKIWTLLPGILLLIIIFSTGINKKSPNSIFLRKNLNTANSAGSPQLNQ